MEVNKKIIKERKYNYGDNFKDIAQKWNKYLKSNLLYIDDKSNKVMIKNLAEHDVARMMALMKQVRIDFIRKKMLKLKTINSIYYDDKIEELQKSLDDNITDQKNYYWIAANFKEYEEL